MAKRKRSPDGRSSKRRQRDDILLHKYSHLEYQLARYRRAIQEGVPVEAMSNKNGHRSAIAEGFKAVSRWFNALPAPAQDKARAELCWAVANRESMRSTPGMELAEDSVSKAAARIASPPGVPVSPNSRHGKTLAQQAGQLGVAVRGES
jgi:hypothetical protein